MLGSAFSHGIPAISHMSKLFMAQGLVPRGGWCSDGSSSRAIDHEIEAGWWEPGPCPMFQRASSQLVRTTVPRTPAGPKPGVVGLKCRVEACSTACLSEISANAAPSGEISPKGHVDQAGGAWTGGLGACQPGRPLGGPGGR
ncbi:hypothetical protein J7T55_001139 [Diaporthe amygdali]|uniref:uncharacterized protein n=1 Tax=Phomopsis amygdali TaxID=1214568 RepID=UPI0022FDD715|nr:uncharacterized protein J7T55_001139 [Diaporthe amygdali]KAJ0120282.1 hypothetical protein J7T55_001139 [Diaporthe amygdali]